MNIQTHANVASLCLLLAASLIAVEAHSVEPQAQTREAGILVDCTKPSLPSQRKVGDLVDQHNFSQVYATRGRLMAEARRACQRKGATRVLVQQTPVKEQNRMAVQSPVR